MDAILYYRTDWKSSFKQLRMNGSNNEYVAIIPEMEVEGRFVEYYISMRDKFNITFFPKLKGNRPFRIKIIENPKPYTI
jgi:hypothetical protein